jgi:zinc transport system substrate-binding protein
MNLFNNNAILIGILVAMLLSLTSFDVFAKVNFTANNEKLDNASEPKIKPLSSNNSAAMPNITTLQPDSKVKVLASFYPIYEFVKEIGKDMVEAESLIPMGIEPHDFEPTVQHIQNAENADLIVYNGGGFEGQWPDRINNENKLDLARTLNLTRGGETIDPHIWLDPILVKEQVGIIMDELIKVDPANTNYYKQNAQNLTSELDTLDTYIKQAFSSCLMRDFIAFHNAFSYFADRYGLTPHSISQTLAPEGEVLPQRIPQIIQLAQQLGINTIYAEDLIDPRSAQVIAQEIPGGKVLTLSPIEGITEEEQNKGMGYMDKMKQNVDNLKIGLECN